MNPAMLAVKVLVWTQTVRDAKKIRLVLIVAVMKIMAFFVPTLRGFIGIPAPTCAKTTAIMIAQSLKSPKRQSFGDWVGF